MEGESGLARRWREGRVAAVAGCLVVGAALVAWWVGGAGLAGAWAEARAVHAAAMAWLSERALVFFVAMAVLPAVGAPLLPFNVAAGVLLTPRLGAGVVLAAGCASLAASSVLGYAAAGRLLGPRLRPWLACLGIRLPEPVPVGPWHLVAFVRILPALPFWAQSWLLGSLRVPLVPYVVVSTAVPGAYLAGCVLLGWTAEGGPVSPWKVVLGVVVLAALAVRGVLYHRARVARAAR